MAKKIIYESFVHHLLTAARDLGEELLDPGSWESFRSFLDGLEIVESGARSVVVNSSWLEPGVVSFELKSATYYSRGDAPMFVDRQKSMGQLFSEDEVLKRNREVFKNHALQLLKAAKFL